MTPLYSESLSCDIVSAAYNKQGQFHLEKVALGDLDVALKLEDGKLFNCRIGNVMWRSPEGQLGTGVGKHSEVFSFGLLVS